MGDVVGLVETVQGHIDQEVVERMATKVKRGRRLNLEDFRAQPEQLRNMGGIGALLDKIPGMDPAAVGAAQSGMDDSQIRRQMGIIDSMTVAERRRPELINGSRKRRIASGAGLEIQDVNRLLKRHRQLAKTMKRVAKGRESRSSWAAFRAPQEPPSRPWELIHGRSAVCGYRRPSLFE
jgi:signal recognition particle subunit SRP54